MIVDSHSYMFNCFLLLQIIYFSTQTSGVVIPWLDSNPFEELQHQDQLETNDNIKLFLPPVLPQSEITDENRSLKKEGEIPFYVVDSSPLVHLYSEERYWPSDIRDFVTHFSIKDENGVTIVEASDKNPLSLARLTQFFKINAKNCSTGFHSSKGTFMTSFDDFDKDPEWLLGSRPEYGTGHIKKAPAVLIVVDKGNGWVDAFWFYFYPFNWGAFIMGYGPWGNHVGDWEHSLVRFYKGEPKYVWMSAHSGGTAYRYGTIEKIKKLRHVDGKLTPEIIERPLIFSARGTHANYASVGQHPHDVPFFFMPLSDFTDRGPMWDPTLNYYAYTFDGHNVVPSSDKERDLGTGWLYFEGSWGDKELPGDDPRQRWCPAQLRYISGPLGPLFKNLERVSLCSSFPWWNFWNGCPTRRFIKHGNGLNAERNDFLGDNCGVLLYKLRPKWLRSIFRVLTWRGILCFVMEFFTG